MQIISRMMVITAVSNVADCCVYYLNGSSGILQIVLVFLSGSWLFLGNVLIGYTWAQFIMTHMNIRFTDTRKKIYKAVGMCCLHFFIFWTACIFMRCAGKKLVRSSCFRYRYFLLRLRLQA